MNHLVTRPAGEAYEMYFSVPEYDNDAMKFEFSRAAIGCVFPEHTAQSASLMTVFGVVVGERVREAGPEAKPQKSYLVLDEAEASDIQGFSDTLVSLKDKYLIQTVFCPAAPVLSVETLRDTEGLTHYADEPAEILKRRFRTYVSRETVAGVYPVEMASEGQRQTEINAMLREDLVDPVTRFPIMGGGKRVMRKLMFPSNLPTEKTREGMQSANEMRMGALWLAVHGLENTMGHSLRGQAGWEHRPGKAGY